VTVRLQKTPPLEPSEPAAQAPRYEVTKKSTSPPPCRLKEISSIEPVVPQLV
jgi:hypothetical protein